ncbi:hypothetical protein BGZ88_009398 [Linnemannia elongata]|nr:hypothetical protein BGZ88_009398 [Linnemannia elongata]
MAEQDLKCNLLTCRSMLSSLGKACVTTCSHIFCVGCANKAFGTALVCPACETSLTQQDDVVFVDLNPSQEYRSSILSGLRPEVIMEICTRAISFWTYQTSQEAKYQEMSQKTLEDKLGQLERQLQRMTREVNVELNGFRDTVSALQKDIEQEKRKAADLTDQLDEKSRQLSKLQTMYDRQKRRPLFPDAASQQGSGRSIFSEDPVTLTTAGGTTGTGGALGIRGDPYQLYQRMDTDATPRPFVKQAVDVQSSMPSLYTSDSVAFAYDPPSAHLTPVGPGGHSSLTADGRVNAVLFTHGSISQRIGGGVLPLGAGRPVDFSQQQHPMFSQGQGQGPQVPPPTPGSRGGFPHHGSFGQV